MQADKATVVNKYGHKLDCNCDACLTSDECKSMRDHKPLPSIVELDAIKQFTTHCTENGMKLVYYANSEGNLSLCGVADRYEGGQLVLQSISGGRMTVQPNEVYETENQARLAKSEQLRKRMGEIGDVLVKLGTSGYVVYGEPSKRPGGYSLTMTRDGTTITASADEEWHCVNLFEAAIKKVWPIPKLFCPPTDEQSLINCRA